HRSGDAEEVAQEFQSHVNVVGIVRGKFQRNLQHILAEQGHPCGAVRLLEIAAGRQRRTAVENADIVQSQKSALEKIAPGRIFAIDPTGEIQQQLPEGILEKLDVFVSAELFVDAVGEQSSPSVNRRIDVAEVPFVGGNLAARVQIDLVQHQIQL